ncbi:MAG TPA: hypothetical protein VI548_04085 [Chitinophagaceae bacterium]|nr:hypothetical protein [Chitinophagaceae bacterium]
MLTFRITTEEISSFSNKHLALGIAGTWLVGIGRYWDHENANLLQYAGLGSVIYIFILAAFIWLIVLPYKPANWKYKTVLTFISLTSFPAILYAIPVEKFMSNELAASTNAWFLLIVAAWRVALLFSFLNKFKELLGYVTTITFLPLVIIVSSLSFLNLEKVVFNIMGGIRHTNAAYKAYDVLLFMTVVSVILLLPFIAAYIYGIFDKKRSDSYQIKK